MSLAGADPTRMRPPQPAPGSRPGAWSGCGPARTGALGGIHGKTSARAIARMYAVLGEVGGVRLLSPERLREATTAPVTGVDEVFGLPTT